MKATRTSRALRSIACSCLTIFAVACSDDGEPMTSATGPAGGSAGPAATVDPASQASDGDFDPVDWTARTHGNDAEPDYAEVFDDAQVKRLDIVIDQDRWGRMLDDMTATYGEFGAAEGAGQDRPNGAGGAGQGRAPGAGAGAGAAPAAGGLQDVDEDPIFVPAEVFYAGRQWYRVGVRFKGNSSLQSSWRAGILKLSFKLDFDEYEDDYPQIDNQRFYGFEKFSLKNNYKDASQLREKVAAEVFDAAGVPVSHTAFYAVYVDHGNGPEYFGLYTLVEEVDGEVIFPSSDGHPAKRY